jgi:hypothetical protein
VTKIGYDGEFIVDLGDDVALEGSVDTSKDPRALSALHEADSVQVTGAFDPGPFDRLLSGGNLKCLVRPITDDVFDEDAGTVSSPHFNVRFERLVAL